MKVDNDLMPIADTNYVKPTNINMVEIAEDKIAEEFVVINAKEATTTKITKLESLMILLQVWR